MEKTLKLIVNGESKSVTTDPDRPLLEVLREDFHLTGTKYGCGEGRCGACTVVADGKSTHSCVTPVGSVDGQKIVTIEGLATDGQLHPIQQAFVDEGASQCGYCTAGMIMTLFSLLEEKSQPSDAEVLSKMEGNLCRCCNYVRLLSAVRRSVTQSRR